MPLGILDVPSCALWPLSVICNSPFTHTISINELCISYVAMLGYTHMDIMQAIIASVYRYIVVGEFKGRFVHLSSSQGCSL